MKQKNNNAWIYWGLILVVVIGVIFVATKDISPISHHVEKDVAIDYTK